MPNVYSPASAENAILTTRVRPRNAFARYGIPLLLFVISFAVQIASLSPDLGNPYDEAIVLFAAQRILNGDIPYRDFWSAYSPGQFHAVAALFKLAFPSIVVARLWDVAIRAGITTLVYLWASKLGAGFCAFAAWLVVLLMLSGVGFHEFPVFPAMFFALLSASCVLGAVASERPAQLLFIAGVLAGLTTLFRHDMGVYLVVAETIALAWSLAGSPSSVSGFLARRIGMLLPLALGVLLVAGPAAFWLLANVPLNDLWFDPFVTTATIYPKMRDVPFPSLPNALALLSGGVGLREFTEAFGVYFPLVIGPLALGYLAATAGWPDVNEERERLRRLGILLLALITLLMYLKGIVRVSALHLLQSIVPAVVLFSVLIAGAARATALRVPVIIASLTVGYALTATLTRDAVAIASSNLHELRSYMEGPFGARRALAQFCAPKPGLERARCFRPRDEDARVVQFIQSRTEPGEPIFVGAANHDRLFINNIILYFLSARPSATKWHHFEPGIQTSAPIQAEMIAEFKALKVRYLVLSETWQNIREPNASALSSGVTLLDDYVRANFEPVERIGDTWIWQRR